MNKQDEINYVLNSVYKKISNTFIGRDDEMAIIKKKFDCLLEGENSKLLITGDRGIGKTFLVEYTIKELQNSNITYIYEKSREYEKKPFIMISGIIEQILKHLLTLPAEQFESVKKDLIDNLNFDVGIMLSICPYSKILLGENKEVKNIKYERLKYKIRKTVNTFFLLTTKMLFPLVIFIDDIQWADNMSLDIIKNINKNNEYLNVMIIIAICETETESIEDIVDIVSNKKERSNDFSVKLHKLSKINVKNYVEFIFGENIENVNYLVRFIFGLTLGNPFYVKEIIEVFIQENIIKYSLEKRKWFAEISNINNMSIPTDIEQVIENKMGRLNEADTELLEVIACFDGKVEYEILLKVMGTEKNIIEMQLKQLCIATFLLREEEYQESELIKYSFVHDIIYELVYKGICLEKKSRIHYNIAKIYLKFKSSDNMNRFFLVSQLFRSNYKLIVKENTSRWIDMLYQSGIEEKQSVNVERSLEIFRFSESILPYASARIRSKFKLKLNLEIGECEFVFENYNEAEKRFELSINMCDSVEDLINIKKKYMNLYAYKGEFRKAFDLGLKILKKFKFSIDSKIINLDLIEIKFLCSNKKIGDMEKSDEISDERIKQILEILLLMLPISFNINEDLFSKVLIKIAKLSLKYNNSDYLLVGYAATSYVYFNIWKDYKKGVKLENKTLELMESMDEISTRTITNLFIGIFLNYKSNPIKNSIIYLQKAINESVKTSDFSFCGYSVISMIYVKYTIGMPLKEISDYIEEQMEISKLIGESSKNFIEYVINKHINYLENGITTYKYQVYNEVVLPETLESLIYQVFTLQRYYFEGELEKGYQIAKEIEEDIIHIVGHMMYYNAIFYCLIVRLSIHNDLKEKDDNKKVIDKLIAEFEYQMTIYKYNYYVQYLLMKAKYAEVFENRNYVEKYFNEAILISTERGYLHLEGLANLIGAKFHKKNMRLSLYYAEESIKAFKKWGALYICSIIEREFKISENQNILSEGNNDIEINVTNENILNNINEIELMNESESFEYLLNYISEKYNTDYCAILFEKIDKMYLQFEKKDSKKNVIIHNELINMKNVSYLSRKIIRYVARTGEEVNLNRNQKNEIFSKDLYIAKKDEISILCIPIDYFGVFVGMVYLEKESNDGFSENISCFIKSLMPTLMSKREIIKDINIKKIFKPDEINLLLTDREKEVLELVAQGMSNATISKTLFIALGTVKNHLSNIYSKLEVDSRVKAVIKANEMNIINV
jgi:predicted ATPase/DNA-binding CsgD family transcriptional regulator